MNSKNLGLAEGLVSSKYIRQVAVAPRLTARHRACLSRCLSRCLRAVRMLLWSLCARPPCRVSQNDAMVRRCACERALAVTHRQMRRARSAMDSSPPCSRRRVHRERGRV